MKAKIEKFGYLYLDKFGEMEKQFCPYSPTKNRCGTWCPMLSVSKMDTGKLQLKLCNATYIILPKNFIKER